MQLSMLEKFCLPPFSVLSGQAAKDLDLTETEIAHLAPVAKACPCCGVQQAQAELCADCLREPPSFTRTQMAFAYQGAVQELVKQFKFGKQRSHGRLMAQLSADKFDIKGVQALVPVPLHPKRRRERGFNQAQRLAHYWAKYHALDLLEFSVMRILETKPQATLPREQRLKNVQGAFKLSNTRLAAYQHIALVDDVMTTGTTVRALADLITQHYPNIQVDIWVFARAQS